MNRPKILVIGAGMVGSSSAAAIAGRCLGEVFLYDVDEGLCLGRAMDINHSLPYQGSDSYTTGCTRLEDACPADIVVITAGLARKAGMTRYDLLKHNAGVIGTLAPKLASSSPDARVLLITNPSDVLTWHLKNLCPDMRIFGLGCSLDMVRLRMLIAQTARVSADNVAAMVIGTHDDNMIPLMSHAAIGGIPLSRLLSAHEIEKISAMTRTAGSTIVNLMKNHSGHYAAGEVVENPASVVKELMENAIDAGAQTISIRIAGGGKELIEISDDGSGIAAQEVALAVKRFATSKIDSIDDLQRIHSLGFRGEALASIGAVSHLRIQTRCHEEQEGSELVCDGGKVKGLNHKGFPQGSRFEVRELFSNVPARLKFLKSDRTERSRIAELVSLYALAYPNIRFMLEMEGRISLQTSGNGNQREILAAVYDLDSARQMLEISFAEPGFRIEGFCSPVGISRSNRRDIHFFVNGRLIQDVGMTSALVNAYHSYLMVGRYPIAVVFLEVPPEEMDINIHPAKAEVRFADAHAITGKLVRAVRLALLASSPAPSFNQSLWANSQVQSREEQSDLNAAVFPPTSFPSPRSCSGEYSTTCAGIQRAYSSVTSGGTGGWYLYRS